MNRNERRAYLRELRPYLIASIIFFAIGTAIGAAVASRFPGLADQFGDSIAGFLKTFRDLPKAQLAAAIFLNNSVKTLAAILLGLAVGIVPALFLVVNGVVLVNNELAQDIAIELPAELQTQPRLGRHNQFTLHRHGNFLPQTKRPRHVFDSQTVGNRRNQMHMNFREQMAHHRQIECLGHGRDFHPVGNTAYPNQIDHDDIGRAGFDGMAKRRNAVQALAAR